MQTAATPSPSRRKLPRWQVKRGHSRVAATQLDHTLGELVDIGLGGFQIQCTQPLPALDDAPLWVILDQSPRSSHTTAISASPVWNTQLGNHGQWRAGFRFVHLDRNAEANLLLHLKSHPVNYTFVPTKPPTDVASSCAPLTVILFGFQPDEQRRLHNILTQSALRPNASGFDQPTYLLHTADAANPADLILLNADDLSAVDACTAYVMDNPSIPIVRFSDRSTSGRQHTYVPRQFESSVILKALDAAAHQD